MGADEEGYWHGKHDEIHGESAGSDPQRPTRDRIAQHLSIRADCAAPRATGSIRRAGSRDPAGSSASIRLPCAGMSATEFEGLPKLSYAAQPAPSNSLRKVLQKAEDEAKQMGDEYVSTEHLLLGILDGARHRGGEAADALRRDEGSCLRGADPDSRRAARDRPQSGGQVPGAGEVRPRPDRAGAAGQARPGHRPRRGDPARDAGALAPDEEQPGPDRRARRRQDGDRRGAGAAHRPR